MPLDGNGACDGRQIPFADLFVITFFLVCETIGLVSVCVQIRRIKFGIVSPKRKAEQRSSKRIRSSQALGVKRMLLQSGGITTSPKDHNMKTKPWEIEYKRIKWKNRIGAGNFGEVWVATWLGSPVAVKTVVKGMTGNEEFREKFLEEIDLMSQLHHPNIVMFLGACIKPPNICLVLELCVFGDLLTFLQSEADHQVNISMHIMLKMALDIARGINYLHQKKNIIQRDIKSRNVLVDENLNAKVADFGLSRLNEKDVGMTACGTPAWTAPEVVRMEEYTEKVDVVSVALPYFNCSVHNIVENADYSFAVVLWELIMRAEPYDGEGGVQIAYAAAEQGLRPEVAKFVPEPYTWPGLMTQCWADSPDDRPGFGEILERLFQMMKDESDPVRAPEFYFGRQRRDVHGDAACADVTELARELLDAGNKSEISRLMSYDGGVTEAAGEDKIERIMRKESADQVAVWAEMDKHASDSNNNNHFVAA